jgi:hypothetical protein
MAISTTTTENRYVGNGKTITYPYTFKILSADDIKVMVNGVETKSYTLIDVGNENGGSITFNIAPAAGAQVILYRDMAITQETVYVENDPFHAKTHENALDRLTMITQQLADKLNRVIIASITDSTNTNPLEIPGTAVRANKLMGFDSNGNVAVSKTDMNIIDTLVSLVHPSDKVYVGDATLSWDGSSVNIDKPVVPKHGINYDNTLVDRVWSFQTHTKEEIYSSPVGPYTVKDSKGNSRDAILVTSMNWMFYALDVHTGEVIWDQINTDEIYGRVQAVDLEGDGVLKIYVPCHDGRIRRVNADGSYDNSFVFYGVYDREGSGTVTSSSGDYIVDNTKNWHNNAFIRVYQPDDEDEAEDNAEVIFTSGNASGQSRRISYCTNNNRLYLYGGVPTGVANGDSYIIEPAYDSDRIFMHAGQLIKENDTWYLYTTSQDSHVYKINAHTGDLVWKYAGLEAVESWPWVGDLLQNDGSYTIWVCYDQHMRCHNSDTGALMWDVELDGLLDGTPQVAPTGPNGEYELYTASRSGKILKIDKTNGSIIAESGRPQYWQDVACTATPLKRSDGKWMIYIGGRRGDFGAYDCKDMYPIWKRNVTPDNINSSARFHDVTGDGKLDVIIGDMAGTIHIFGEDGNKITEVYCKGAIEGMPLIADIDGDGKVEMVVTTCDGWVHCFRFANGVDTLHWGECPDAVLMPIPPNI